MNTESGYSIDMHIYKAVEDPHSGLEYLQSFGEIQGTYNFFKGNLYYKECFGYLDGGVGSV